MAEYKTQLVRTGTALELKPADSFETGDAFSALISTSVTMPENHNSVMYGPIAIAPGGELILEGNSNIKIIDIANA